MTQRNSKSTRLVLFTFEVIAFLAFVAHVTRLFVSNNQDKDKIARGSRAATETLDALVSLAVLLLLRRARHAS